MHLYNAWLPPPVIEEIQGEEQVLSDIVANIQRTWKPEDPSSKFATLKWISLVNNLIKAKTTLAKADLDALARLGLDVFLNSADNLFVQVRWGSCLTKLLNKYHKEINLQLEWRPFYELMLNIHFKRRKFFEGIALKQIHLETLVALISSCRRFFYPGSASEIWSEFRPFLEDIIHNSSLEAIGFLSLFLPTKPREPDVNVLNCDWLQECLRLWDGIPDCPYWDRQWAYLIGRFIKDRAFVSPIDLKLILPSLFGHYLNVFEVPVAKSDSIPPVEREVPYDLKLAFNGSFSASAKNVAKGIVYLLRPDGYAQSRFEQLVDLLEQYYHPSNGGSWTSSLEQLLRHLSYCFLKRLSYEQQKRLHAVGDVSTNNFLGPAERENFVRTVARLVERGQYSKNVRLAVTASNVASGLAFVVPSIILPFVVSRFEGAMVTVTATHQLESALTTLALSSRAILLASAKEEQSENPDVSMESNTFERLDFSFNLSFSDCKVILVDAMFTTLLGMDANDPPKTLATVQFYSSIISSVGMIGEANDGGSAALAIDWSQWLDEFLSRLFVLLRHVESSSHSGDINLGEGSHKSSSTFLMQEQSLYSTLVELLFGRLTKPLFQQALKKVAKFVHGNILPGAVTEMGLLCSALVYANPFDTVAQLLLPVMRNILMALNDTPSTGFGTSGCSKMEPAVKVNLSPAVENSVSTQVTMLSLGIMNGGPALLQCQDVLKDVLVASFNASSLKVNEAGDRLLSSLIGSLVLYYPIEQYRSGLNYAGIAGIEAWISTKDHLAGPKWHIPSNEEREFAEELLNLHLRDALVDLENLCQPGHLGETSGQDKDRFRVLLLRINGSMRGVRSCLPDFDSGSSKSARPLGVRGKAGIFISSSKLREQAAETLLKACEYFLKVKSDATALLLLLVRSLDLVGNYGSSEYNEWSNGKHAWRVDSKSLVEPRTNFITGVHSLGKRRPQWLMIEMAYLHNLWRASQAGYRQFDESEVPPQVTKVAMELLKLSLHNYDAVRLHAGSSLRKMLKRFPPLVKNCIPLLTSSLQDPEAVEHSALGACTLLMSRPVLRHVAQDWSSLASFMLAVLNSSHHESVKAQSAISELAISFSVRFGGVPTSALSFQGNDTVPNYAQLISHIKDSLEGNSGTVHWRYKLMAHVALLCLVLPLETTDGANKILDTRKVLAGNFLNGVGSDLPPLRPLSVIALLLLLHSGPYKDEKKESEFSLEDALVPILQDPSFTATAVKNLSLDHHYSEGHGRGSSARFQGGDMSITSMMPAFVRQWPSTRNWVLVTKGEAFSPKFAKLFKRLIQECGPVVLNVIRIPLEEAANAVEERGMQCIAAEIIAGFLHSDVVGVAEAWDGWLGALFHKAIMQANVESLSEWAACIRFSVSGKGRRGVNAPLMRHKVLQALVKPLPSSSSTSLVSKRLQYLLAAVVELRPLPSMNGEMSFQLDLLLELMGYMAHPAPQVRQSVGKIMCVLGTNLQEANISDVDGKAVPDWTKSLVDGAIAATAKIQKAQETSAMDGVDTQIASTSSDIQETVKYMETVLQFVISSMASGRAAKVMPVLVEVLPSVLSLQETSHKDMSGLAKLAVYLYKWQPFRNGHKSQAVAAIISAANDNNWRTRVATLSFLQSFIYRHTFTLDSSDIRSLWDCVKKLLSDPQLEVRELASTTFSGMLKGLDSDLPTSFRAKLLSSAQKQGNSKNNRGKAATDDKVSKHGTVMGLKAFILSAPYDIPRWFPDMIVALANYIHEPSPISTTVTKTIAEFRRTHADTWSYQKNCFSEEQLEVLADLSSSASYFA